jgi:hypothetical protein
MDEDSNRGIVISQGITRSWTRNPPIEWLFAGNNQLKDEDSIVAIGFRREFPTHRQGIHQRKGIP